MKTGMNQNDDGDSHRRDDHRRLNTSDKANSDLLSEIRREMECNEGKGRSQSGWDGQKDGFTIHHESPGVPYASKVSFSAT